MTYLSGWWSSLPSWAKGFLPLVLLVVVAITLIYAMAMGFDVMVWFRWLGDLLKGE